MTAMDVEVQEFLEDNTLEYEELETEGEDEPIPEQSQRRCCTLRRAICFLCVLLMVLMAISAGILMMLVDTLKAEARAEAGAGPVEKAQIVTSPRGSITITPLIAGDHTHFAHEGDLLYVSYVGRLADGTVFDRSYGHTARHDVFRFWLRAGSLIEGWVEALPKMSLGERALIQIPSALGYGAQGKGKIPPNADLTFDMQLIGIGPHAYSMLNISKVSHRGDGKNHPGPGDTVYLHFKSYLPNGTKFDDTREHPYAWPFKFTLGMDQTDYGMEFAVQLLTLGENATVHIPAGLAFGRSGAGPVPPNTDLIFDIELLGLIKRDAKCFDDCPEPGPAGYEVIPAGALRAYNQSLTPQHPFN